MKLSRIRVSNFRNFASLDVPLDGNVVVVGENRVGKSNLLHALRLLLDPTLPDSARQLTFADFRDGLDITDAETKIVVSVELTGFDENFDVLAVLTDFRLDDDAETVRLTYEFRAKAGLDGAPATEEDFEFVIYGGEDETKRFGHDVRRRLALDLLPALRDVDGDLTVWRRSPLRPLLEKAFSTVDSDNLQEVATAVEAATARLAAFPEMQTLEASIGSLFAEMSGPRQDVKPSLGFGPADATRLYRSVRLLIDGGERAISDASLGSANLAFLTLKALELRQLIEGNKRDHTFLCIEEPEAHLHPHLQRSVYRHLFESARVDPGAERALSIVLTTHSPHIASVAPLRSLLLLKDVPGVGSVGYSAAAADLDAAEADDIARYLDVTRAEMLFARGVILVEGDAERFLVPAFAARMGVSLDHLGITVCSVAGTNFVPYAKFLRALGIPFSIMTDWDPADGMRPYGFNRARKLIKTITADADGNVQAAVETVLGANNEDGLRQLARRHGVLLNEDTFEVDMFNGGFHQEIIETLRERLFSKERSSWIDAWEADPDSLDREQFLALVEAIGKGRFAQRLASRLSRKDPPGYIANAIQFVVDRV